MVCYFFNKFETANTAILLPVTDNWIKILSTKIVPLAGKSYYFSLFVLKKKHPCSLHQNNAYGLFITLYFSLTEYIYM
jgi:hypothetical protein